MNTVEKISHGATDTGTNDARTGSGQAGDDSATVRPSLPVNAVPGLYSTRFDMGKLLSLSIDYPDLGFVETLDTVGQ